MDPFTAMLLSAGIQGGTSLLGNLMTPKGSGGSQGYDVVNFNDPQDAGNRASSEAYMMDVLSALRAGKTPDWMNRFTDPLQADMLRQNQQQFFGRPGASGGSIMDIAQSSGAMSGIGGQAGQAPVNKALADYSDRMSGINQYIAGLKNNYMQSASQTVPSQLNQASTQKNSIIPGMGAPANQPANPFSGALAALGGVDFSKLPMPAANSASTPFNSNALSAFNSYGNNGAAGQYVKPQQSFVNNPNLSLSYGG